MNEKRLSRLKETLKNGTFQEKLNALEELKDEENARTTSILFSILSSESWTLRNRAAEIIALRGEKVTEKLLNVLENGIWYSRAAAAKALGLIGTREALPHLLKFINDPNTVLREEVVNAIKRIVEKNGIERVMEGLSEEDMNRLKEELHIEEE